MLSSKYWITNCIILTVLVFSVFTPTLAFAAPLANNGKDWQFTDGNSWAQNYSPQTQISKDNVQNLEVKWVFPVGSKSLAPSGMQSLGLSEGSNTPPIVKGGLVYITTNFLKTYAIDAKTGKQVWTYDYELNVPDVQKRLPLVVQSPHLHGIRYWESGDAILQAGIACDFYAIDGKTGKNKIWVQDLCKNVPGNLYSYRTGLASNALNNIGTYEKGRQFIFVLPGAMHTGGYVGDARHVTMGISMDAPYNVIWRTYEYPPQDVATKDWATQECDIGYFQTYTCKEVAAKNQAALEWDWTVPGQPPSKWGGVTANWGQAVIDEDTGILYTNTGNQGPYTNTTMTPGPRLYGSTIMAIDMNAGKRIWWLQPFPHDPYDYDCNWSGILADVPNIGKVYMKGCKEGRLYVMDAKTGKPYYSKDVINEMVTWGQIGATAAKEPSQGGIRYHLSDPFSYYDLREWNFPDNGKYCSSPCLNFPSALNGLFATDMSYDPEKQTLYHYANALEWKFSSMPMVDGAEVMSPKSVYAIAPANATIIARDVATGNVKWTWTYTFSVQRSHMVVTGGMVFSGFTDGNMRFFDKDTGKILNTVNIGSGIVTGPTIGQDSDGKSKIFVMAGSTSIVGAFGGAAAGNIGPQVPGTLIALGLADKTAASAQTSTVTTATTSTATITSTSTAVSTVEVTSGLPSEVTYAAVAVAVIAIIAAAFLAMRKK